MDTMFVVESWLEGSKHTYTVGDAVDAIDIFDELVQDADYVRLLHGTVVHMESTHHNRPN
jgi:hypothetical protein